MKDTRKQVSLEEYFASNEDFKSAIVGFCEAVVKSDTTTKARVLRLQKNINLLSIALFSLAITTLISTVFF